MAVKIQLRNDTAANWITENPILSIGEMGIESDTLAYKIGNGTDAWNDLAYRGLSPSLVTALFSATSDPTPPSAGYMNLYAKEIGGRMMPKFIGPSGLDSILQPAIFGNGIQCLSPAAATALNAIGMALPTAVGTVSHPTISTEDLRRQTRRAIVTSAATANSASELRNTTAQCWRGDAPGLGGFFHVNRFAISSTTANQRCAVGLLATGSAISTSQSPSGHTSSIFVGWDSADTNLQVMHNDASGTCTKIDLGADFPANDPTMVYESIFFAKPNDTKVSYRVKNLTTGDEVEGVINSNLPPSTTPLFWHAYVNNGGTAAAVVLEFMRMYLETDY